MVVALSLSGLSGCCFFDDTCVDAGEGGNKGNNEPGEDFAAAATATPGCAVDAIRVDVSADDGDTVCAACDFDSDSAAALDICGLADSAPCETRENNSGDACQLCVTDGGVILYDDCFAGQADRDAAFCEDFDGADATQTCSACFDKDGNTVSTTCAPRSDACVAGDDSETGRSCTVCSAGGEVVSRICEAVDIDPAVCRVYGNDVGSCVDCLDDAGHLLSHACTRTDADAPPPVLVCEETVSAEGIACTICVDENGTPAARSCDDVAVEPARCEQLAFVEQTCIICLDSFDSVVSIDCVRNECDVGNSACRVDSDCGAGQVCFDGGCVVADTGGGGGSDGGEAEPAPPGCAAPPACTMSQNADNEVCRTCPFTTEGVDGATLQQETLCLSTPSLSCAVEEGSNDADFVAASCVVCVDRATQVEVYRDCTANGTVPPPYCVDEVQDNGDVCAVCYDAVDDTAVYTACDAPGGETCFDLVRETLNDSAGAPLHVTADDGTSIEAVVACKQCGVSEAVAVDSEAFTASCALENVCSDPYGSSQAARCEATTTVLLAPACANPWDAWLFGAGDDDVLKAILAYALGDHGIALAGARVIVDGAACDDGSARVELAVSDADVDAVNAAFAAVLAP